METNLRIFSNFCRIFLNIHKIFPIYYLIISKYVKKFLNNSAVFSFKLIKKLSLHFSKECIKLQKIQKFYRNFFYTCTNFLESLLRFVHKFYQILHIFFSKYYKIFSRFLEMFPKFTYYSYFSKYSCKITHPSQKISRIICIFYKIILTTIPT